MLNETAHSFFVSVSYLTLLLSPLSGLYCVHGLHVSILSPVACRQFLPLPSFQSVFFFSFFSSTMFFYYFIFGLLALSYLLVSLPDLGSHFAFLFLSAFVYIPMLCDLLSCLAICFIKSVTMWSPLQKNKGGGGERGGERERERTKKDKIKRCQNFKLPNV